MPTIVAACQVPALKENINASLDWIERFSKKAEQKSASLVCFPECFLQGYLTNENIARKNAVNLDSASFKKMIHRLESINPIIVFGLIESDGENIFNTAVVVKNGMLLGKYRKTHLLDGERIFERGSEYPVFQNGNMKFGINICYDTQFPECSMKIAKQGATLILCPANNMMKYEMAEKFRYLHNSTRIERAKETKLWIISSDVTGEVDGRISYGPTAAINPIGQIVDQVPLLETGMITVEILDT
ncbi:MAG: carbon-nitrogen hydrolase family protein [Candidatus Marinimicrobia bacterium]|jgi:predicted amidohydrolase|nr:carbon-nitrogen hydrolase family protein [Candidatus Neomarinimicrobiota bacterium]